MIKKIFLLAVVIMTSTQAHSVSLNVVGDELIGGNDVLVGGSLYDVIFRDGTCALLYSGCDEASDFTFQTALEVDAASQALIDQVFGGDDIFDMDPGMTRGITNSNGHFITPYYFPEMSSDVGSDIAINNGYFDWQRVEERAQDENSCGVGTCSLSYDDAVNLDSTLYRDFTFALWTPITSVPEPGTLALFAIGLFGMGLARRRRKV